MADKGGPTQQDGRGGKSAWRLYASAGLGVAAVVTVMVLAQRYLGKVEIPTGKVEEERPPISMLPGETVEEARKRIAEEKLHVEFKGPADRSLEIPKDADQETREILEAGRESEIRTYNKNMELFKEVRSTPGFVDLQKYNFPLPEQMDTFKQDLRRVTRTYLEKSGKMSRLRDAASQAAGHPEQADAMSTGYRNEAKRVRAKAQERLKGYDPRVANAALERFDESSRALYLDSFYAALMLAEVAETVSSEFDRMVGNHAGR